MNRHAYLIMAHNNFEQLAMLCRLLDDERNDLYIMIDSKVPEPPTLNSLSDKGFTSGVYFTDRVDVRWGGYSQIKAELTLLETALKNNVDYEYFHLLSGVDLPLKTNDQICNFFDQNKGKEFLHFCESEFSKGKSVTERASLYHFFQEGAGRSKSGFWYFLEKLSLKFQRIIGINRLKDTSVYCGANWFSITSEFAKYILSNRDWIYKTFSNGFCVDELFLQTLIMNSPFRENLYRSIEDNDCHGNMRYIDWKRGNPYNWRLEDFDELIESDYLFARKFDISTDKEICEKISDYLILK
ncbi:MAG: glycosyl transferase [Clostridia bacterium]|nr:glycosyl transferase [Clostridia bacterium]